MCLTQRDNGLSQVYHHK